MAFSKIDPSNLRLYPLDDMYYTLEIDAEDWEADQKRRKTQELELSKQKTLESKMKEEVEVKKRQEEEEKKKKALAASKAAANSSRELRSLLSDVKTNKKWQLVTMMYEGQEELYEKLDDVVTKLKDYQEHSYPFLRQVRASDAPGYFDVIKKPMDLSLITKKLRHGEYSSKSEFQADLTLMYANCRIYNTDPQSRFMLEHADALEKKSKELMKHVKNIDFSKERKAATLAGIEKPIIEEETPATPTTSKPRKAKKTSPSPDIAKEKEHSTPSTPTTTSAQSTPSHTPSCVSPPPTPSALLSPVPRLDIIETVAPENVESKTELFRCLTRQYRMHKMAYRTEQNALKFADRDAVVRNPDKMNSFVELSTYSETCKSGDSTIKEEDTRDEDDDEKMKDATNTLPPWLCNIPFDTLDDETEQFSRLGAGFFPEITHFSDSVPNSFPPAFDPISYNRLDIDQDDNDNPDRDDSPMHHQIYYSSGLKKAIANLLLNAGFSGVHDYAMDVLVDIVAGYFHKLGRVIRVHMDSYGSHTTMEEVLSRSFCEMGLNGILAVRNEAKAEEEDTESVVDSPPVQNSLLSSTDSIEPDNMQVDNKPTKTEPQSQPQTQPQPQSKPQPKGKEAATAGSGTTAGGASGGDKDKDKDKDKEKEKGKEKEKDDSNYDSDTPLSHKARVKRPPIKKATTPIPTTTTPPPSTTTVDAATNKSPAEFPKSPIIKVEVDDKKATNATPAPPTNITPTPPLTPPAAASPTPPPAVTPSPTPTPPPPTTATTTTPPPTTTPPASSSTTNKKRKAAAPAKVTKKKK